MSILLIAILYLHLWLHSNKDASTIDRHHSKPAEDVHYHLAKHHAKLMDDDAKNDDASSESESGDDHPRSNFRDPGEHDEPLTPSEVSKVKDLRLAKYPETVDDLPYDIHWCPPVIPKGYPHAWSVIKVLEHWNPDDTNVPPTIHQGVCAIDWRDPEQRRIAVHYRKSEVPFLVKNHPTIWRTASKWADYDYLHGKLGRKSYRNEHSTNNHMMYWKLRGKRTGPPGWKPPTEDVKLSFAEWHKHALELENGGPTHNREHFYLRLNGSLGSQQWLYKELEFFHPQTQNDIFMVDPSDARGINCRLGSRGTIAETHYDMSRNFILILHGRKRYVLGHPDQCINMELYPNGHPSARHTRINWSDRHSWYHDGSHFQHGRVNEVVLEAGDGLYLPTYWFHFIVSLSLNYQCNARSGISLEYQDHIAECGFH